MASADIVAAVKKLIQEHAVLIFSKTYCPFCTQVKNLFQKLGAKAHIIELDTREDGSAMQSALMEITGQRTVPNVFVGHKHVGGCDDTMAAHQSGELAKMLQVL